MAGFVVDNRRNRSGSVGLFQSVFARIFYERCIQLDLALDSNDLARLNGFNVREADEQVWQEVFQTIRSRDMGSSPARSKISRF
jgi:hypothetical protein